MLIFLIGCLASMIFGACVMFTIIDIYMLQRKVDRLKRKIKKMMRETKEPEVIRVIDVTEKEEEK